MAQLTTEQAAKALNISPETLKTWRSEGKGPAYTKTGAAVRYPDHEIERFIRENTIRPGGAKVRELPANKPSDHQARSPASLTNHRFKGRSGKQRWAKVVEAADKERSVVAAKPQGQ